jgi:hypothetical protein
MPSITLEQLITSLTLATAGHLLWVLLNIIARALQDEVKRQRKNILRTHVLHRHPVKAKHCLYGDCSHLESL